MGLFDEIDDFNNNPQDFMSSGMQERVRSIMNMDKSGALNKIAKNADIGFSDTEEPMSLASMNNKYPSQKESIQEANISNSKLPKEILKSFKEKNIDISSCEALDEITRRSSDYRTSEKPLVTEQKVSAPQTSQQIDYSVIKAIVDESIRKYTSSLKKSLITESKDTSTNLRALKIGDKFSFIDESGNLYEAKLTFVKNLNEQKKRG